jgi:sulfur relay (sulfurtransferase) DsrC/TusE family protein
MAVLESHGLAVEIKYARYHASWVEYDFRFSFMGRDIFNREIMNTRQSYSYDGQKSQFFANEELSESIADTFRKALSDNESTCWTSIEPDISIEIAPTLDDMYQVTFVIDTYYLQVEFGRESFDYYGEGPAVRMMVERASFEKFVGDLKEQVRLGYEEYNRTPPV